MQIFVGLVVLCVISILVYALSSNAKVVELARITFAVTLLALCFHAGPGVVHSLR
jgi:hypothetical protein